VRVVSARERLHSRGVEDGLTRGGRDRFLGLVRVERGLLDDEEEAVEGDHIAGGLGGAIEDGAPRAPARCDNE